MKPKFRAWDKENNQMLFPDDTDKIYFEITEYGIVTYDMNMILPDGTFTNLDTEVMQSTGLKDKNGIEIFEGDIVKWTEHVGAIEFLINNQQTVLMGQSENIITDLDYCTHFNMEIIGNIYENPELLKFG